MLRLAIALSLAGATVAASGCEGQTRDPEAIGQVQDAITDVQHTAVERQSIGNCWLYAQATWVESLHLAASGDEFDVSQSYWTYWHWFDQITGYMYDAEISTGGNQYTSNALIRDRGIMAELDFVPTDSESEMSSRQSSALNTINSELKSGRLADHEARQNGKLVREVMDEAWGLTDEVRQQLDSAFGEDGEGSLRYGGSVEGTTIIDPTTLAVKYTERDGDEVFEVEGSIIDAIGDWRVARYPSAPAERRALQIRVQRALHDRQPVVVTWNVDFNAMENGEGELRGSFNSTTLANAGGPGSQGGHMTVLEDYEAVTEDLGLLKAGETLDPENEQDAAKLDAALADSTQVRFFRTKNSWGGDRPDRAFAPGFPGYHDLYIDYLDGPMAWCPSRESGEDCNGEAPGLRDVMLPKGY
jgi:hypothetical protein